MGKTRDKLVGLLEDDDCPLLYVLGENVGSLADHLIANGVTVQQWIPVAERLPLCGERVLITEGTTVFEAYLSISHKWVRAGIGWVENVTHWMPLPAAPGMDGA